MMNHNAKRLLIGSSVLGLAFMNFGLTGCGGGEEEMAQAPRVQRTSSAASEASFARLVSIRDLMGEMGIDKRVELSEDKAPDSTEQRRAVLDYFDSFARGDHQAAGDMMSLADQFELEQLVESGEWKATAEQITEIYVETGKSPHGLDCAFAIFEVGDTYQPQLWYYMKDGQDFVFEAVSAPPGIMNRLYGLNPIDVWHRILDDEEELANTPDDDVEIIQVVVGDASSSGERRGSDGQRGLAPSRGPPMPAPGRGIPGPTPGGR